MIQILFHPLVLLLIAVAVVVVWRWAKRVNLRVRLARLPTPREWAVFAGVLQLVRWLLRLRI